MRIIHIRIVVKAGVASRAQHFLGVHYVDWRAACNVVRASIILHLTFTTICLFSAKATPMTDLFSAGLLSLGFIVTAYFCV